MKNYYVKFKTLGMTLCAGLISGSCPDTAKEKATDMLARRHVRHLDDAWIEDEDGQQVVILNMNAYKKHSYEWLTIR